MSLQRGECASKVSDRVTALRPYYFCNSSSQLFPHSSLADMYSHDAGAFPGLPADDLSDIWQPALDIGEIGVPRTTPYETAFTDFESPSFWQELGDFNVFDQSDTVDDNNHSDNLQSHAIFSEDANGQSVPNLTEIQQKTKNKSGRTGTLQGNRIYAYAMRRMTETISKEKFNKLLQEGDPSIAALHAEYYEAQRQNHVKSRLRKKLELDPISRSVDES